MPIEIAVPGSKSITNRSLILAALSAGRTILQNAASSTDSDYLIKCLKELGINIEQKNSTIAIQGCGGNFPKIKDGQKLYTHNAGTTTRFLTALCTLTGAQITIDGDERMRERPISALTNALREMGLEIETTNGCVPITIKAQKLKGGTCQIAGDVSSQYISALLMIAPFTEKGITIQVEGELCSKPYIDITINVMKNFGLTVKNLNYQQFEIKGQQDPTPPSNYHIESDASSISYIGGYAALNPETPILLKGISPKSIQGDIRCLQYLEKMGCQIEFKDNNTLIRGPKNLKCLGKIDMNDTPDLVMTFALLSVFAKGKTTITNIANLKIKETDRLEALKNELEKLEVSVETGNDFISITGLKNPETLKEKVVFIKTYNDHRIALSFGMIKRKLAKLELEDPSCVSKSYPSFWEDLAKLESSH